MTDLERFLSKVDREGPVAGDLGPCWIWTAARNPLGYGAFGLCGRVTPAHRASCVLHGIEIPCGHIVCHRCDNPPCVNPAHLFVGTHRDNIDDKIRKGRQARGSRHSSVTHPERVPRGDSHGCAVLTSADVIEIRRAYAAGGVTQESIARLYEIHQGTVSAIVNRKKWRHIA